jgi:hypothetical protein
MLCHSSEKWKPAPLSFQRKLESRPLRFTNKRFMNTIKNFIAGTFTGLRLSNHTCTPAGQVSNPAGLIKESIQPAEHASGNKWYNKTTREKSGGTEL